jgi:hypothetical protein
VVAEGPAEIRREAEATARNAKALTENAGGGGGGAVDSGPGQMVANQIVSQADKNSDQKVSKDEFQRWLWTGSANWTVRRRVNWINKPSGNDSAKP